MELDDRSFPQTATVSASCKALIKKLLIKDQFERLGSKCGASEIKQHAFFKGPPWSPFEEINWGLLTNKEPPLKPNPRNQYDTSHFRNITETNELNLETEVVVNASFSTLSSSSSYSSMSSIMSSSHSRTSSMHSSNGDLSTPLNDPFENFESVTLHYAHPLKPVTLPRGSINIKR